MKFPFLFILGFLLVLPTVFALPSTITNSTCASPTISETNTTLVISVNGVQNTTVISEPHICPFGCNGVTGVCNQVDVSDSGLTASLIPMLMALGMFGVAMAWKVVNPWDIVYRIIFLFFGMFFALSALATSSNLINITPEVSSALGDLSETNIINSTMLLWILVGTLIFLTMIQLIQQYFSDQKQKKEKEEDGGA